MKRQISLGTLFVIYTSYMLHGIEPLVKFFNGDTIATGT